MKKVKRWQVVAVAIVAIIVVARIKVGQPLGLVALEAYQNRHVLLTLYQGAVINTILAVLGFLPLAVSVWWVNISPRMSTRWETCFSGKAYRLREYWSVPAALFCGFVLFIRHSLVGLVFMLVGLTFFWAIGPGKVMLRAGCVTSKRRRRNDYATETKMGIPD